jgi:hypothetical protein
VLSLSKHERHSLGTFHLGNLDMKKAAHYTDHTLVLVGNPGVTHVGAHLHYAAKNLGFRAIFVDVNEAFTGSVWWRKLNWWGRGHRPPRLRQFSTHLVQLCREIRPTWLLATGLSPLTAPVLEEIGQLQVVRLNYLTDDPWNPAHRAPWLMKALPLYDHLFSPRRANLPDLKALGCQRVSYLPFAYAPEIHFPDSHPLSEKEEREAADVVFVGGADRDRVPLLTALLRAGFRVELYGAYWERFLETRANTWGEADPQTLRRVLGQAKVVLCLVRRANRDGHAMRTFEVAAIGACMLTEDTLEHREIFGEEGVAVVYFQTIAEMITKLQWLLTHDEERRRLARAAHHLIVQGRNTYTDRLTEMLRGRKNGDVQ